MLVQIIKQRWSKCTTEFLSDAKFHERYGGNIKAVETIVANKYKGVLFYIYSAILGDYELHSSHIYKKEANGWKLRNFKDALGCSEAVIKSEVIEHLQGLHRNNI